MSSSSSDKIYLCVPYDQKDEAKQLGAKWDKDKKQWYIASNNPNTEQMLVKWSNPITFSSQNNKSLSKFFNPAK